MPRSLRERTQHSGGRGAPGVQPYPSGDTSGGTCCGEGLLERIRGRLSNRKDHSGEADRCQQQDGSKKSC